VSTPPATERPPRRERRVIPPLATIEGRAMMRNRLIDSRLTPNAISLTGLALNLLAAALVWRQLYFLGGVAFIVGSIMDTLDGRYSRMSGKGSAFGAFLDSTLDRCEEGIVLTAVAVSLAREHNELAVAGGGGAALASLMVSYARARGGARRRVQGRAGDPRGAGRDPLRRPGLCARRLAGPLQPARARGLRAGRAEHVHRPATHLARSQRAEPRVTLPAAAGTILLIRKKKGHTT